MDPFQNQVGVESVVGDDVLGIPGSVGGVVSPDGVIVRVGVRKEKYAVRA